MKRDEWADRAGDNEVVFAGAAEQPVAEEADCRPGASGRCASEESYGSGMSCQCILGVRRADLDVATYTEEGGWCSVKLLLGSW